METVIRIYNDGKGKRESFEAWIEGIDLDRGYGASASEAIECYKNNLSKHASRVLNSWVDLKDGEFDTIHVDWAGNPVIR